MKKFINLFKDESGQGMVEYGLIIAVVALVVVIALGFMGGGLSGMFDDVTKKVNPTAPVK